MNEKGGDAQRIREVAEYLEKAPRIAYGGSGTVCIVLTNALAMDFADSLRKVIERDGQ